MLRRLSILALAVALAACGSDGTGPEEPLTLDQLRVRKISGDQEARVPGGGPALAIAPAGVRYAVVGSDGYTDEPLVARVEPVAGRGLAINGTAVPRGTLVHWDLPEDAGRLRGLTTATDDSAHVINRWAPGTVAGTYTAEAVRILGDGSMVTDATWELVVLPGPISRLDFNGPTHRIHKDSALVVDLRPYVMYVSDAYGNEISLDSIRALPDDRVGWAWYDRRGDDEANRPTEPTHTGWTAPLPALDAFSERCSSLQGRVHEDGSETSYVEACTKLPGIVVWIDGHLGSHPVAVVVRTSCTILEPDQVDPHVCDW